jgi:hypothetical protein
MDASLATNHFNIRVREALLGSSLILANSVAQGWEAVSRMEDRQRTNSDDNHDTFQHDELGLVAHDFAPPATAQLRDTVDTSGEDGHVRNQERANEASEVGVVEQRHRLRRDAVLTAASAYRVIDNEEGEDSQGDNLHDNPSNHKICADVHHVRAVGRSGGDTSTRALEHKREDVASDEDVGVPGGPETRPFLAKGDGDVLQGEVDTSRDKGGRDDEAADLNLEAHIAESIVVE